MGTHRRGAKDAEAAQRNLLLRPVALVESFKQVLAEESVSQEVGPHRRGAKGAEAAQRNLSLRPLCALCASAVSPTR